MANDFRRLSKQERILWSLLESMDDFLHEYLDDRDHGELQPRLAKLDEAYIKFSDVRIQIEVILEDLDEGNDDDEDSQTRVEQKETRMKENKDTFKEFVNRYFSIKQQLLSKMDSIPTQPVRQSSSNPDPLLPCHTKYPELTLPTFNGKLSDWINFRDNFRSLIHDNQQLNDMDKFNYLRASLTNDALLQINQIQVAAMNYGLAWSTLQSKYEKHKLIAQEHMKELFAAVDMQTESFEGLNALLTTFKTNLQQLEKLGQRTSDWSTLLAFMLSQKLDTETYRLWETHHASKNVPTYEAMIVFLETQCSILQSTANRHQNDEQRKFSASVSHSMIASERLCPVCRNGPHQIESCSRFGRMRVIDRKELVRRLKLCFNCLNNDHFVSDCTRRSCSKCEQRHHYLLHPYSPSRSSQSYFTNYPQDPRRPQRANSESRSEPYTQHDQSRTNNYEHSQNSSQSTQQPPPTNTPTVSHHTATVLSTQPHAHTAILSTAIVMLADSSGNTILARALLDNGSQICLMTKELSQKLKFERFQENLPVKGVGGSTNVSKESVLARIVSCSSSFTSAERKFYVLSQITIDLPQRTIDVSSWKLPPSISLADPDFYKSSSVDLVIGVSTFYDVLLPNQMRIGDDGPILQNSHLGWIVAGELPETTVVSYSAMTPTDSSDKTAKDLVRVQFPHWRTVLFVIYLVSFLTSCLFDDFVSPTITQVKMFLQELWREKLSLDETWKTKRQLYQLKCKGKLTVFHKVPIPRWITFYKDLLVCRIRALHDSLSNPRQSAIV
ncbi:uncharacterized protein LOC129753722 [Uranotaenia lowii]|uniref:uncharacterized protein LOC129753722 n=1 Tax=Uranotaenia lowii TaxID=190385 RepID=UPI00247B1F26|nr:uncharacterized protein LOC129753722 [Uranotaenia lowii]